MQQEQVRQLMQTLSSYSQTANDGVQLLSQALRPISLLLMGVFLLLELNNWQNMLKSRGQGMTKKLWVDITIKYFIAFLLVMLSDVILDAILYIGIFITSVVNKAVPMEQFFYTFDASVNNFILNILVGFLGGIIQFVANFILIILLFMRFIELYILKAIAPVLVAFFMFDPFRSVTFTYFKTYLSYVFVATLLLVVTVVYNYVIKDDIVNSIGRAAGGDLGEALGAMAKGIIYILIIVGTTKRAKQLMGVS